MKKIGENCIVNRKNISHVVKRQESEKIANFFLTRFLPHSIVKNFFTVSIETNTRLIIKIAQIRKFLPRIRFSIKNI
jgi:hypothetical protein